MKIDFWLILGFFFQSLFAFRFLVQWIASEQKKKSVIPTSFWFISLIGGLGLLTYAIHKKDPVFITGQLFGVFVYIRNIQLTFNNKSQETNQIGTQK